MCTPRRSRLWTAPITASILPGATLWKSARHHATWLLVQTVTEKAAGEIEVAMVLGYHGNRRALKLFSPIAPSVRPTSLSWW